MVSARLMAALFTHVKRLGLGEVLARPVDVRLSDRDVYQPDIIYLSTGRYRGDMPFVDGAPDLVVEIQSPLISEADERQKHLTYAAYGVREYWIVDPIRHFIEVMDNVDGVFITWQFAMSGRSAGSSILDGFSVMVDDVFRD